MMANVQTNTSQPEPKPMGYKELLSIRHYLYLLGAQFVSDLGEGVYRLALAWAMLEMTGSALMMSTVLVAQMVPAILFGIFAGVMVDRGNKRKYMLQADLYRGLVVAAVVALWYLNWLQPWMLIVASVILASFTAFFTPARSVAVRFLVPDHALMQAKSLSSSTNTIVSLVAPALGGLLVAIDMGLAFLVNAVTFFLSLLLISLIRNEELTQVVEGKLNFSIFKKSLQEGYKTIMGNPTLKSLVYYVVLLNLLLAPSGVLIPMYAFQVSDMGATGLAVFEITYFAGVLLGSIALGYLTRWPKIALVITGIVLLLVAFLALAFVENFYIATVMMLVLGLGTPMTNVPLSTMFALKVPRELLGRASSAIGILTMTSAPLALSLSGSVLAIVSISEFFMYISGFGLLLVVMMLLNPVIRKSEA